MTQYISFFHLSYHIVLHRNKKLNLCENFLSLSQRRKKLFSFRLALHHTHMSFFHMHIRPIFTHPLCLRLSRTLRSRASKVPETEWKLQNYYMTKNMYPFAVKVPSPMEQR